MAGQGSCVRVDTDPSTLDSAGLMSTVGGTFQCGLASGRMDPRAWGIHARNTDGVKSTFVHEEALPG